MPNCQPLGDAAADVVPDDAGVVDSQRIHQLDHAIGVGPNAYGSAERSIAPAVAEHVEHHHAVTGRHERNYIAPQMSGGWETVQKDDRLADATRSRSIVVKSNAADVDELTAHWDSRLVRSIGVATAPKTPA